MNRVGLKDYLLNHADDNDLLDRCEVASAAQAVDTGEQRDNSEIGE